MIADLNTLENDRSFPCDVCIVGSGAAGLAIANELIGGTRRVMLVESGGQTDEPATQELYRSVVSGHPFNGAHEGRFRVFGGTTTRWGGQALPLTPLDFETRPWVSDSGWPIRLQDLQPYYTRASRFLRIDTLNYDTDLFELLKTRPPGFDPQFVDYHFSKWSPTPNLGTGYGVAVARAKNLTLLLHANATRLALNDDLTSVKELNVQSLAGKRATIRAKQYVLCCGGIETARILLTNNSEHQKGIGNAYDLVGRYLMDHPAARIGTLRAARDSAVQRSFNLFHKKGQRYAVRCSAPSELQRRQGILNISASVKFEVGERSDYEVLRQTYHLLRQRKLGIDLLKNVGLCAAHAPGMALPLYHYYVKARTFTPNASFSVVVNSEQEPNPQSRVTLSREVDALGMPRADIHWKLSPLSGKTISTYARVLKEQFEKAGLGTLCLEEWLDDAETELGQLSDQNHHMGTTRMHPSPRHGVVDEECRVHGISNLFVGSSAVFPTGGHSNPTLTLIALCIRLADRLKQPA